MIDDNKTQVEFGYKYSSLTNGSKKEVVIICDYCGNEYKAQYKQIIRSRLVIDKDACKKCRYKKREDISLKQYGVKNSAQRPDIRKKISENCEGFDDKRRKVIKERYGVENPMQSDTLKERQKQSVINKYGVENVSQVKEIRDKVRKTNLEKYGNEEFLGSTIGREKSQNGMMNKYGVVNAFQSEDIKKKIKEVNLSKYGVKHPIQSDAILKKRDETVLERYGCKNVSQSEIIKNKIKSTNLTKYGTKCVLQNYDIRKKIINTNMERYGCKTPLQNSEVLQKVIKTKVEKGIIKIVDNKTMLERAKGLGKPYSTFIAQIAKYGFEKALQIQKKYSSLEEIIRIFFDINNIKYQRQFMVENRYADFYLSDYNIIIETDGLYWHSELFLNDDYHINKRQLYIDNGYVPLFFREDEIHNKFDIIKSIILNKMGQSNRIFARKCSIIRVDKETSKKFFAKNHLMSKGRGDTYGLVYNNELISCLIISKIKDKKYEISRFCHKCGYQVVGGLSKLIRFFVLHSDVEVLTTFIDRRYGSGEYLTSLGFKFIRCDKSFSWTNFQETFHRMKFKGNSGYDKGLVKLWDCGQARYDLFVKS